MFSYIHVYVFCTVIYSACGIELFPVFWPRFCFTLDKKKTKRKEREREREKKKKKKKKKKKEERRRRRRRRRQRRRKRKATEIIISVCTACTHAAPVTPPRVQGNIMGRRGVHVAGFVPSCYEHITVKYLVSAHYHVSAHPPLLD